MKTAHKRLRDFQVIAERYQVEEFLGAGDCGEVYRCRDLGGGKARISIKVFHGINTESEPLSAFSGEFSFLRRLRHQNLVRLLDFGILKDTGKLFLVEEFVAGKDIYSASEEMNTGEQLNLIVSLSKAILYLHSQGIVHGNLKPSNAVLREHEQEDERLKLMDFGFGRWVRKAPQGNINPMPLYTAPEVLLGGMANAESDLYSLGILIYQLLTRRLPFGDEDPGFLIQKHLQGSIDLRPIGRLNGGSALSQLLSRLLDKDPVNRPRSMGGVLGPLGEATGRDCSGMDVKEMESYFSITRFVGREKEMASLQGFADRVRGSGRGWTVFLTGEAGSGKTRCMEELRSWALLEGWRVIEGTCGTREEGSYAPFRQILARTEPAEGETLFDFGSSPRVPDSDAFESSSEFAAGQFRDLLTRELVRRLKEHPTLLLLDDFNMADEATCTVLDYLSSDIQAHAVLLCVSLRTGEEPRAMLGKLMELVVRQERGEVLMLEPLSAENVESLVATMTGDGNLSGTLGPWIYRNIGGNPFFLEEMMKHLAEQGLLRRESGSWIFIDEDLRNLDVPASLGAMLQRRLRQLSPLAQELSRWLALMDRAVSKGTLISVMSKSLAETNEALQELSHRQMVRLEAKESDETVEFRHALIAEVIRGSLPKPMRRKMHRKIAEVLEQEYGPEGHLQELAVHYMEGGHSEKANEYVLKAAAECRNDHSFDNALLFYKFVLATRNSYSPDVLSEITINAAESYCALGSARKAIKLLTRTLSQIGRTSIRTKSNLLLQLAISYRHDGNAAKVEICADKALRELKGHYEDRDSTIRASLLRHLAYCQLIKSRPRQGLMLLNRALRAMSGESTSLSVGQIYALVSALRRVACDLGSAVSAAKKSIDILSQFKDFNALGVAYSHAGACLLARGRFAKALECHERAVKISEDGRSIPLRSQALSNYAECLCRKGQLAEAKEVSERAVKFSIESGNPMLMHSCQATLADIKITTGDYQGANDILCQLIADNSPFVAIFSKAQAFYLSAWLNFELGDFDLALSHVSQLAGLENCEAPVYERELGEAIRACILFQRTRRDDAIGLLLDLERTVTIKRWPYQSCLIKLYLGEYLAANGNLPGASRVMRNALRLSRAMNSDLLLGRAHLIYGRLHFRKFKSNSESSIANAKSEFERAIRLSDDCGDAELQWRSHAEMSRIEEILSNWDSCLYHSSKTIESLQRIAEKAPKAKLPSFWAAFDRRQTLLECELRKENLQNKRKIFSSSAVDDIQEQQIRTLFRVSRIINSIRELDPLLESIVDLLIEAVGVERAMVFLENESTGNLELIKGRNIRRESLVGAQAISQDILEEVSRKGSPFVSADAKGDPRVTNKESFMAVQLGTILCAPLKVSGRVLGVLYADHSTPAKNLSESTISLFAAFCNLAAIAIDNALAHQQLIREKTELEQYLHQEREGYVEIVGESIAVKELHKRIDRAADSPLDILITGESGTGKELVARAIYKTGRRKSGRFLPVDCGSLSDSLAEAELFGYRKGAFTGATENRQGLLEAANGGVIFLDEIANLSFRLQAKLLRALQEREIRRLGETVQRKIDIQVFAATNKDLMEEMRIGTFRKDFYYRLKAMEIRVPALRERQEDIPILITWALSKTAEMEGGRVKRFSPNAMQLLRKYTYPGNVRELIKIVEGAYYSTRDSILDISHLPLDVRDEVPRESNSDPDIAEELFNEILEKGGSFADLLKKPFSRHQLGPSVVRGVLHRALKQAKGNYREAFAILGIPARQYSPTMLFLKRNNCYLDYRSFRNARAN